MYKFELSEQADMSNPIVSTIVNTTAYQHDTILKCNTNYFWRVQALEPWESDWSATFSFQTKPEKEFQPVIQTTKGSYVWIWVTIGIYLLFIFLVIRLIIKTRSAGIE